MSDAKPKLTRLTTPVFRASYPHLFKAQKALSKDGAPQFSIQAIWKPKEFGDKDKALWNTMLKAIKDQIKEVFPKLEGATRAELQASLTKKYPKAWIALRSGTEGDFAERSGYGEGTFFARLHSESPPGVVDLSKTTIHPTEGNADEIYPGCYCRATITIKAYDHKESGGKGYTFYLGNVQKVKDGPRLDSRVAAGDEFDEELDEAWMDEQDETAGETADEDFGDSGDED